MEMMSEPERYENKVLPREFIPIIPEVVAINSLEQIVEDKTVEE